MKNLKFQSLFSSISAWVYLSPRWPGRMPDRQLLLGALLVTFYNFGFVPKQINDVFYVLFKILPAFYFTTRISLVPWLFG